MPATETDAASPRKARRKRDGDGSASRQRVLDAAIACILSRGLYRASSNAIAEQAGLSWGVIQYYFGSREALMLAVLEEGARRLTDSVRDAAITGTTVAERVGSYSAILERYYGSPDYLAFTQVMLGLSHDPRTSDTTMATLRRISEDAMPPLRKLQDDVLAGVSPRRPEVRTLLFHALRGLALSHVMLGAVPSNDMTGASREFPEQRGLLAEALALLIERDSAPEGPAGQ
ncbi:MAG: TetR/AcrR family transcriptional regulator [Streptosporangiales bacterium]|jgi:AcrR family transcriptional regulator|nr:TetR/AcrR family transcriptional regulator [Streptosporangiales bacterium]